MGALIFGAAIAGLIALLIGARNIIFVLIGLAWIVHDPLDALLWIGGVFVVILAVGFLFSTAAEG